MENINFVTINKKTNLFLERTEYDCIINAEGATPSRKTIIQQIHLKLQVPTELIVLRVIKPQYGKTSIIVEFDVYNDKKRLDQIAPGHLIKRSEEKEEENSIIK